MGDKKDCLASVRLTLALFYTAFEKARLEIEGGNPDALAKARKALRTNAEEARQQGMEDEKIALTVLRGGFAAKERFDS